MRCFPDRDDHRSEKKHSGDSGCNGFREPELLGLPIFNHSIKIGTLTRSVETQRALAASSSFYHCGLILFFRSFYYPFTFNSPYSYYSYDYFVNLSRSNYFVNFTT